MYRKEFTHTFAICAYQQSEYLESCIKSLLAQKTRTNVIICTSTPCEYIQKLAEKYALPYYVRDGASDIQDDWNYACECAKTDLVTLAHQDDQYSPDYATEILREIKKYPDATIVFSDYRPLKHYRVTYDVNCFLRRMLRLPVGNRNLARLTFVKRLILCMGNTICCSAVTYNTRRLKKPIFTSEFKFSLDWDTFYKIAKEKGCFLYIDKPLTFFRIHSGATTNKFIISNGRYTEDVKMFKKIWPDWTVRIIMRLYILAYRTYKD